MTPSSPGLDAVAQLDHFGMELSVVADANHASGFAHRLDRGFCLFLGEGERLLAIDVFAGRGGRLDLLQVAGRRRGQHDGVDLRIGQHHLVTVDHAQRMLFGERLDVGLDGAGLQRDETHGVAAGQRLHHGLAPGAEPDHRGVDHIDHSLTSARSSMRARSSSRPRRRDRIQNTQYSKPPKTQIHFLVTL